MLLVLAALIAPLFCPSRGVLSTILTGLAVVLAVRTPDLERERLRKTSLELFVWLLLPVFRFLPRDPVALAKNRRCARRTLLEAAVTASAWIFIHLALESFDPASWPWQYRSAALILYFVLAITSLEALLRGVTQGFGATTDQLFNRPLFAVSLRDFWGRRWNTFIARFALRYIATRQSSKASAPRSVLTVFFWSALFHEYFALGASGAEWIPGSMLLFFCLQGIAMLAIDRVPVYPPRPVANVLTALWMVVTAPLFFASLRPPLGELGYEASWFVPIELRALNSIAGTSTLQNGERSGYADPP